MRLFLSSWKTPLRPTAGVGQQKGQQKNGTRHKLAWTCQRRLTFRMYNEAGPPFPPPNIPNTNQRKKTEAEARTSAKKSTLTDAQLPADTHQPSTAARPTSGRPNNTHRTALLAPLSSTTQAFSSLRSGHHQIATTRNDTTRNTSAKDEPASLPTRQVSLPR